METGEVVYPRDRTEWHRWLADNYQTQDEVWVRRFRKDTGIPSIPCDDLVEECLCFGWITEAGHRREAEMQRRLDYLIRMTRQGRMYGTVPLPE